MSHPSLSSLTPEQMTSYRKQGYLLLENAVSEKTLELSQLVLERWVAAMAARWQTEGRINDTLSDTPFSTRLLALWEAAGRPGYNRSPRRELVSPEMFDILKAPELVDIAQDLLGTTEVSAHGIFNARPKLPSQSWTDTPWHQDAQYFRDAESIHVPTMWFPLQDVSPENSCLQVAPGLQNGKLHKGYDDPETGFLGVTPEVRKTLVGKPIEMKRGDVLLFTQMTPHGAMRNRRQEVRWSMDLRFESTDTPTSGGKEYGFIARSLRAPESVCDYQTWRTQWGADLGNGY